MKKIFLTLLVAAGILLTNSGLQAQTKIGYISLGEFMPNMPEFKKADSSMQDYKNALSQEFEDQKRELNEQDSLLSSKDTVKYTKAQLEIKRRSLGQLYVKVQGFSQQAQEQLQQKQQELIAPIQKKALEAIQAVAKENGFAYVLQKEALYAYPAAEDLLPLVKRKLGIK
ncbi:MAG: OmpH family outer membrane protein [Bacteroidetes bacterium]|jgi:outer membrane protein|nr:OmpH family outer membrane protein [Bacteroidota bacterium]